MTRENTPSTAPEAHLLISTYCPHCQALLNHLAMLVKNGEISRLVIDNLDQHPELARERNVRSLPWLQLGRFQFSGAMSLQDLRRWITRNDEAGATEAWFAELMSSREVETVVKHLEQTPDDFKAVLALFSDADTELVVRIGIGVVFETLAGHTVLQAQVEPLMALCDHPDARVRADACHYLELCGDPRARETLTKRLQDDDEDVRESARDALETLSDL